MNEEQASLLTKELHFMAHHVNFEFAVRSRETEHLETFPGVPYEDEGLQTDNAATLIQLTRFPPTWLKQMTELLYLSIQTSVKPGRP